MGFWFFIIALVASYAIGGLLAKAPDDAAPDDGDPFGSPQSKPGDPVTIVFGTRLIKGINVLWYGGIYNVPVIKCIKAGFSTKCSIIGYRYFLAVQNAVCFGFKNMTLKEFRLGEDVIFKDKAVASAGFEDFSLLNLYGGADRQGGVEGRLRFYNGVDNMAVSPVFLKLEPKAALAGYVGQLPQYRNLVTFSLSDFAESNGFETGYNNQVKPASVIVVNCGFDGAIAAPRSDGVDVNPITVLRAILVSDGRFANLSSQSIDINSLTTAETQIWNEGLLFSPIFSRVKPIEKMIEVILKFVDGVFYADPRTGLMTLKLLRSQAPTGNELVLDSGNIISIIKTKFPERTRMVNEIKLTYTARSHGYENKTITAQDLAGYLNAGSLHNTRALNFPSITSDAVARVICDRELLHLSRPLKSIDMDINREGATLRIGDLVKVNDTSIGVTNELFRIAVIDYGTMENSTIRLSLLEDVYTDDLPLYTNAQGNEFTPPTVQPTADITGTVVAELPRDLLRILVQPVIGLSTDWMIALLTSRSVPGNFFYDIYTAVPAVGIPDSYALTNPSIIFTPKATLLEAYSSESSDFDVSESIKISPTDSSVTQALTSDADNRHSPTSYALIGAEWVAFTQYTHNGDNTYHIKNIRRGLFDTPPMNHAIGTLVWFVSERPPLVSDTAFTNASPIRLKQDPHGHLGSRGVNNVVAVIDYTVTNRAKKPLPVGKFWVGGVKNKTQELPLLNQEDAVLTWEHRNRTVAPLSTTLQTTTGQAKEATVTYTLFIYAKDGTTLIKTVTGLTVGTYTYTKAQEQIDHNKQESSLVFKIRSVDSADGNSLFDHENRVNWGGWGYSYGINWGK